MPCGVGVRGKGRWPIGLYSWQLHESHATAMKEWGSFVDPLWEAVKWSWADAWEVEEVHDQFFKLDVGWREGYLTSMLSMM